MILVKFSQSSWGITVPSGRSPSISTIALSLTPSSMKRRSKTSGRKLTSKCLPADGHESGIDKPGNDPLMHSYLKIASAMKGWFVRYTCQRQKSDRTRSRN